MSKARLLADFISTGVGIGILADGAIAPSEITGVTASASELNVLTGITASTSDLNNVTGINSSVQTQLDAKAASTALTAAINGLGTASALNVGTGANQIMQLDSSGKAPAVDGSNLTGISAGVSAAKAHFLATA